MFRQGELANLKKILTTRAIDDRIVCAREGDRVKALTIGQGAMSVDVELHAMRGVAKSV
jgi:hypothetical protein